MAGEECGTAADRERGRRRRGERAPPRPRRGPASDPRHPELVGRAGHDAPRGERREAEEERGSGGGIDGEAGVGTGWLGSSIAPEEEGEVRRTEKGRRAGGDGVGAVREWVGPRLRIKEREFTFLYVWTLFEAT